MPRHLPLQWNQNPKNLRLKGEPISPFPLSDSVSILRLSGEQLLAVGKTETNLRLDDGNHQLELNGSFANAIEELLAGHRDNPLLKRIESTHPWLTGLQQARIVDKCDDSILLGTGLGMLFIELTSRCNEQCIHCYADSSPEREEMLPPALVKEMIDQACALGQPFIQFTGGDPLIHPDLIELVAYAHGKTIPGIEIYTNGLLLHAPLLKELVPFAPRLCFSLYSCDADTHDTITQVPGSMERTLTAIRRTQATGLEVRIGIALMQQNAATLPATVEFLHKKLGIDEQNIRIDPVHGTGRGSAVEPARDIRIEHTAPPHDSSFQHEQARTGKLAIAANGDIYPCIFSRNHLLGNLNEASLPEILQRLARRIPAKGSAPRPDLACHDCRMIATLLGA